MLLVWVVLKGRRAGARIQEDVRMHRMRVGAKVVVGMGGVCHACEGVRRQRVKRCGLVVYACRVSCEGDIESGKGRAGGEGNAVCLGG